MAQFKEIVISLPDSLLEEVDRIACDQRIDRNEAVALAMRLYVRQQNKRKLREDMELGYRQMAEINLELSQFCLEADNETLNRYEEKLGNG